jgi:hypothetical protein
MLPVLATRTTAATPPPVSFPPASKILFRAAVIFFGVFGGDAPQV